jgi:hypothetical protein
MILFMLENDGRGRVLPAVPFEACALLFAFKDRENSSRLAFIR